jgi:hypothetical protein
MLAEVLVFAIGAVHGEQFWMVCSSLTAVAVGLISGFVEVLLSFSLVKQFNVGQ